MLDKLRVMFGMSIKSEPYYEDLLCNNCTKSYCCSNRTDVDILTSELQNLKLFKSVKLRKKFKKAIHEKKKRGSFTCPFLEDGKCSIYDNRPLSCASFFAIKDTPDSTSEQCNDFDNIHGMITMASFVKTIGSDKEASKYFIGYIN